MPLISAAKAKAQSIMVVPVRDIFQRLVSLPPSVYLLVTHIEDIEVNEGLWKPEPLVTSLRPIKRYKERDQWSALSTVYKSTMNIFPKIIIERERRLLVAPTRSPASLCQMNSMSLGWKLIVHELR